MGMKFKTLDTSFHYSGYCHITTGSGMVIFPFSGGKLPVFFKCPFISVIFFANAFNYLCSGTNIYKC
jgi:hypothetical protein